MFFAIQLTTAKWGARSFGLPDIIIRLLGFFSLIADTVPKKKKHFLNVFGMSWKRNWLNDSKHSISKWLLHRADQASHPFHISQAMAVSPPGLDLEDSFMRRPVLWDLRLCHITKRCEKGQKKNHKWDKRLVFSISCYNILIKNILMNCVYFYKSSQIPPGTRWLFI